VPLSAGLELSGLVTGLYVAVRRIGGGEVPARVYIADRVSAGCLAAGDEEAVVGVISCTSCALSVHVHLAPTDLLVSAGAGHISTVRSVPAFCP
jgi:hypothetical protein